jgi:hypothetical protein
MFHVILASSDLNFKMYREIFVAIIMTLKWFGDMDLSDFFFNEENMPVLR